LKPAWRGAVAIIFALASLTRWHNLSRQALPEVSTVQPSLTINPTTLHQYSAGGITALLLANLARWEAIHVVPGR